MPRPNEPELRPHSRGERVFVDQLAPGDVVDLWAKRSGGFFLVEDTEIGWSNEDDKPVTRKGRILRKDVGWAEIRRVGRK